MIEFAEPSISAGLAEHGVDAQAVEKIIAEAEVAGNKLFDPTMGVFLTKADSAQGVVYIKYSLQPGGIARVLLVYSTKARFI